MRSRAELFAALLRVLAKLEDHASGRPRPLKANQSQAFRIRQRKPLFHASRAVAVTFLALTSALLTSARAANPNLGLVQDLHVLPVPAGAVETCFVGSTSRRHACVDAMTSTVLAVDRVPTAKISVSDNSIGSARTRGEKGRRRRTPKQRLAIRRRQTRCKRSDDLSRHSRRVWSCGTMNRVKADPHRVLCLKRFLG